MKKYIIIAIAFAIVGSITGYGYFLLTDQSKTLANPALMKPVPSVPAIGKKPSLRDGEQISLPQSSDQVKTATVLEESPVSVTRISDSTSTLSVPVKIVTSDSKEYFIFGQPKGQNSKSVKKIIFSLPGHGSTAEQDYEAWKSHIKDGSYALASLNWWHGGGEKLTDYYAPSEVRREIRAFLDKYGYVDNDFVVLEGFSRGSANTYSVKAYDNVSGSPVIDAVISASGKYQSDFPLTPDQQKMDKLYQSVPWILACGAKDDNPTRDGCEGMAETKIYLTGQGADVLALFEDPKGAHGAFHQSPLDLPEKALALFDKLIK